MTFSRKIILPLTYYSGENLTVHDSLMDNRGDLYFIDFEKATTFTQQLRGKEPSIAESKGRKIFLLISSKRHFDEIDMLSRPKTYRMQMIYNILNDYKQTIDSITIYNILYEPGGVANYVHRDKEGKWIRMDDVMDSLEGLGCK